MGPGSEDRLLPRRTAALLVLLLALQALLIGGVVRAAREVRPHGLPLAIVAPPVVGASLATEIDDLPVQQHAHRAQEGQADVRHGGTVPAGPALRNDLVAVVCSGVALITGAVGSNARSRP